MILAHPNAPKLSSSRSRRAQRKPGRKLEDAPRLLANRATYESALRTNLPLASGPRARATSATIQRRAPRPGSLDDEYYFSPARTSGHQSDLISTITALTWRLPQVASLDARETAALLVILGQYKSHSILRSGSLSAATSRGRSAHR